jgi:acyl-CoA synthetase (AMP-forming)/AMP-acid ligase II
VVVLKKGANATPEELIAFCKKQIAGYKVPKTMEIVDALPKNSAGKIMKRELREKYWKK